MSLLLLKSRGTKVTLTYTVMNKYFEFFLLKHIKMSPWQGRSSESRCCCCSKNFKKSQDLSAWNLWPWKLYLSRENKKVAFRRHKRNDCLPGCPNLFEFSTYISSTESNMYHQEVNGLFLRCTLKSCLLKKLESIWFTPRDLRVRNLLCIIKYPNLGS